MTGAISSIEHKRQRRREAARVRQANRRQRKAEQGLRCRPLLMTARAHNCLIELKAALSLKNLDDAFVVAVSAQHEHAPPFPRVRPCDPPGIRKVPLWVPQDISDQLDAGGYKERWHGACAYIVAHHALVCGEGGNVGEN